jgi:sulfur carrier protein ThiS
MTMDKPLITLRVKAFGHLQRFLQVEGDVIEAEVPEGSTAAQVLRQVGIPLSEVWLISIDDEVIDEEEPVPAGAELLIMAPVEGG